MNDETLAVRCAHDGALLKRARAEVCYENVGLEVIGEMVDERDGEVVVEIGCAHGLDVRVGRIIREKMGWPAGVFKGMAQRGDVRCEGGDVRKMRFVPGMRVVMWGGEN